mmetsp:Transcript_22609/g.50929  ORF Transcript_22609/g.50929 Transcript_22609/m.50929 type:complete len:603 (+) Transcript_22609:44-1852(+)
MSFKLSLLSCLCFPIWEVESHSYLAFPASRNLLANLAGQETCPHCLQSGGPDNVKERGAGVWPTRLAPGSHGLCGDPVQGKSNPMRLADETYLRAGEVTMTYAPGQVAEFQIAVSTHHQGHYEFRICDEPLDGRSLTSAAEGQACLDQWLLERAAPLEDCEVNDARGDCQPLDPKHPERWYLPPPGSQTQVAGRDFNDSMAAPSYPSSGEVHRMRFKIPEGLRCTKCTLQWYWSSGNSCYYDGDYFDYYRGIAALGWDAAAWQPQILASWANCENSCCKTGGSFGEEFWNCADIAVLPSDGSSPSTSSSSASASTTASTTVSVEPTTSTTSASADFSPVDGGVGRACRGRSSGDNSGSYYSVTSGPSSLDSCKAACLATIGCVGIEYSSGRCEVWTRPAGIQASIPLNGFTCLRLGTPSTTRLPVIGTFDVVNGGLDRACRGATAQDNLRSYYELFSGLSLEECKVECARNSDCVGIESSTRGRCEVWTRAAGIEATSNVPGFSCYRYTPAGVVSTSTTSAPTACSRAWGACGGRNWDGPTCCEEGYECLVESVWYSQCRPSAALAEMPDLTAGPAKKRRFRGSSFLQDGATLEQVDAHDEL